MRSHALRHRQSHRSPVAGLAVATWLLSSACASTGAIPRPFPRPAGGSRDIPSTTRPEGTSTVKTALLVSTALQLLGVPYKNGGSGKDGFDCSGFTQYVFARHGFVLPREVRDQFRAGQVVSRQEIAPGDLVFFSMTARGPSHVAIALGAEEFVHAPSSTGVVRVERLTSRYWAARVVGVKRIVVP